jgi:hypothetical protein
MIAIELALLPVVPCLLLVPMIVLLIAVAPRGAAALVILGVVTALGWIVERALLLVGVTAVRGMSARLGAIWLAWLRPWKAVQRHYAIKNGEIPADA